MAKKGKSKSKPVKQLNPQISPYHQKLNYDIEKAIKPEKINPPKIFEGFSKNPKMKK